MNTSTMTSHVKRLLLTIQKGEWTIYKQREVNDDQKFEALLNFLLQEKNAIEYMNEDIRDSSTRKKAGTVNLAEGNDKLNNFEHPGSSSISTLQRAVEELTKTIAASKFPALRYSRRNYENCKCWIHNTETLDTAECNSSKNLSNDEKIEMIRQNGAC